MSDDICSSPRRREFGMGCEYWGQAWAMRCCHCHEPSPSYDPARVALRETASNNECYLDVAVKELEKLKFEGSPEGMPEFIVDTIEKLHAFSKLSRAQIDSTYAPKI